MFGRPPRDTGLESERNNRADGRAAAAPAELQPHPAADRAEPAASRPWSRTGPQPRTADPRALPDGALAAADGRGERRPSQDYVRQSGCGSTRRPAIDLAWALINTQGVPVPALSGPARRGNDTVDERHRRWTVTRCARTLTRRRSAGCCRRGRIAALAGGRLRPRGRAGRGRRAPGRQGQGGDPDLDVGRPLAPRHVRPQAGGRATTTAARSTSPIATNVDGIRIGELLPLLAKQADKYSIIRSMTHGINGHETAAYMVADRAHARAERLVYPVRRRGGLAASRATTPATRA